MRLTVFENHRKKKIPDSFYISVITKDGTVESGWSNGRTNKELIEDFGKLGKNWFYSSCEALGYAIKNGLHKE